MRGWSIPFGRWMGVEVRLHIFFPLLLLVLFAMSGPQGWPRGLALFILLVAAVAVRETARLLVAAGLGLRLRAIGEMLGTSEEAAKNCLFRATQKMRAALGDFV